MRGGGARRAGVAAGAEGTGRGRGRGMGRPFGLSVSRRLTPTRFRKTYFWSTFSSGRAAQLILPLTRLRCFGATAGQAGPPAGTVGWAKAARTPALSSPSPPLGGERLSCASSGLPRPVVPENGVEDGQQLSGYGDEGDH